MSYLALPWKMDELGRLPGLCLVSSVYSFPMLSLSSLSILLFFFSRNSWRLRLLSRTWRFTGNTALSFYAILVCVWIFFDWKGVILGRAGAQQRLLMAAFFFHHRQLVLVCCFEAHHSLFWFGLVLIWVSFESDPLAFMFYIGICLRGQRLFFFAPCFILLFCFFRLFFFV